MSGTTRRITICLQNEKLPNDAILPEGWDNAATMISGHRLLWGSRDDETEVLAASKDQIAERLASRHVDTSSPGDTVFLDLESPIRMQTYVGRDAFELSQIATAIRRRIEVAQEAFPNREIGLYVPGVLRQDRLQAPDLLHAHGILGVAERGGFVGCDVFFLRCYPFDQWGGRRWWKVEEMVRSAEPYVRSFARMHPQTSGSICACGLSFEIFGGPAGETIIEGEGLRQMVHQAGRYDRVYVWSGGETIAGQRVLDLANSIGTITTT